MNQESRLEEIRNYLIKDTNQNELAIKKHKKVYRVLDYINRLLIVISTITRYVYISDLSSLVGIPIRITSSAIALKICAITAGSKNYDPII